jgi:putative spermidine/putrescine transport system substrate-binding protein
MFEERRQGCDGAEAAAPSRSFRDARGQVDIVAWPGYIERGETDKGYDWVTPFEQDTGCKVNIKTAGTSGRDGVADDAGRLRPVTASGDASLRLVRGGTVQPIDSRSRAELRERRRALKEAPGTSSTASTTARPTSGARTC